MMVSDVNWVTVPLGGHKYRGLVLHFGMGVGLITPSHKIHSIVSPNDGLTRELGHPASGGT
jgi:hypothetical protein